jgi:hypothetical protein
MQDKIKQCQGCNNHASGTDKQLLKKTSACKFKKEKTRTKSCAFKLDDIDLHDNKSCDETQVSVSVRNIFVFLENIIFLYNVFIVKNMLQLIMISFKGLLLWTLNNLKKNDVFCIFFISDLTLPLEKSQIGQYL